MAGSGNISLYGTPTVMWKELNDTDFNLPFNSESQYEQCSVTLSYEGADISHTLKLPVYPEDVTNSISTNYASYDIIGRPGQISAYNSTSDITTQFTLHMHRELKTYGNSLSEDVNHIDKIVSLIEAAQYPYLNAVGSASYAPIVTYKFGDTLIIGKQTSCNTKWSGPKIEGKYMEVTMTIAVTNLPTQVLDYKDIYNSSPRGWGRWSELSTSNNKGISDTGTSNQNNTVATINSTSESTSTVDRIEWQVSEVKENVDQFTTTIVDGKVIEGIVIDGMADKITPP